MTSTCQFSELPLAIEGIRLASIAANIRYKDRDDLCLVELADGATVAGVYTLNAFCAAPVHVCKKHMASEQVRFWLINAGNANAGTGEKGMHNALRSCQSVAEIAQCSPQQVMPFSTGVIGEQLKVEQIEQALPELFSVLSANGWERAANTIMTTDTQQKLASVELTTSKGSVRITGMAKGSGMIKPNMATMLGYLATDAIISQADLQAALLQACNHSFNRITVDGDTSTNDSVVIAATGASKVELKQGSEDWAIFVDGLTQLSQELAHKIVRDGEGATKFIEIEVSEGGSRDECLEVAYSLAHSPLVKTALYASDPNWGRILMAVGKANVVDFDLSKVSIQIGDVALIKHGEPESSYTEEQGQKVFDQSDIRIAVQLGRGSCSETVWTCDFSHEYVTINAEYRS
jgi:glutamate N-acetyltransferase/amino-acid N-acetyltransferase